MLNRLITEPPETMSRVEVKTFLETLDIRVKEETTYANLLFGPAATPERIDGWKDPLEGNQLHGVMCFLRRIAPQLPHISQVVIPERRVRLDA